MEQIAAAVGTFVGYTIGSILKIAGPELKAFLVGVLREALQDSAEMGGKNAALDSAAADAFGLRDKARDPGAGK